MKSTYWGARMTPCESWPHRFASTRLRATTAASAGGTPAASKSDCESVVSVAAEKVGMGVVPGWSLPGWARDQGFQPLVPKALVGLRKNLVPSPSAFFGYNP